MENGNLFQVYSTHVIFLLTDGGSGQQTGWLAMLYICCQDWHSVWSRSTSYSFTWAERHMLASWLLCRIWLLLTLLYEGFLFLKVSEMLCIQFVCLASYLICCCCCSNMTQFHLSPLSARLTPWFLTNPIKDFKLPQGRFLILCFQYILPKLLTQLCSPWGYWIEFPEANGSTSERDTPTVCPLQLDPGCYQLCILKDSSCSPALVPPVSTSSNSCWYSTAGRS